MRSDVLREMSDLFCEKCDVNFFFSMQMLTEMLSLFTTN